MNDVELPLEAEEFLVWLSSERGRSRNTIVAYRRDLVAYQRWLDARQVTMLSVSSQDLIDFVAERRASPAATTSIARQIAAIRMLHRYLSVEQVRPDDPTARLDGVRVPSGIPKPLSEAQVTSLLDAVIGNEPLHRRDRSLLELLYATGARVSEVVEPVDRRHRLRRAARATVRQGLEGAHRSVRIGGGDRPRRVVLAVGPGAAGARTLEAA